MMRATAIARYRDAKEQKRLAAAEQSQPALAGLKKKAQKKKATNLKSRFLNNGSLMEDEEGSMED